MTEQENTTKTTADEEGRYAELARRRAASQTAAEKEKENDAGEGAADEGRERGAPASPQYATLIGQVAVGVIFDSMQWLLALTDGGLVTGVVISAIAVSTFYVWDRMKYPDEPMGRLATHLGIAGAIEFFPGLGLLPTWTAYPLRRYLQKHSRII